MEKLNQAYARFETEKAYCLGGEIINENKVRIDKIDLIIGVEEFKREIIFKEGAECPNIEDDELIGIIHFHPKTFGIFPSCRLSTQDFFSFGLFISQAKQENFFLWGVQCSKDKLNILSPDNLKQSWRLEPSKK